MQALAEALPLILFWLTMSLLAALTGAFLWRRVYTDFPFFFLYVVSAWMAGLVRYGGLYLGKAGFFYAYWISELAVAVLVSTALYEIFIRRLFPGFTGVRIYRRAFPAVALLGLFLTIVVVLQSSDRGAAFLLASRIFDFLRTAFLVFFVGLMVLMGRRWKRYDLGIALGFGIQAAAALLNAAFRARLHHRLPVLDTLETITYDLSCVIWLITFLKPETPAHLQPADALDPAILQQARKWETALKDWLTPGKHIF